MNDELWAYDEPHESGGNVHVTMTKQQAIDWMKSIYPAVFPYSNDELAFNDWVAVHWAYRENQSGKENLSDAIRQTLPTDPEGNKV